MDIREIVIERILALNEDDLKKVIEYLEKHSKE